MDKSSEKWVLLLMVYLGMKIGQCDGDQAVKPQLTSFFYAFYDDTLDWNQSMWNKEMEALRDIQIQSIIVRSVMTEDSMGIVQRGVENCSQIPYLGVFRAFYASSLPCTTHVSDALDKLLIAAATVEIKVYLGTCILPSLVSNSSLPRSINAWWSHLETHEFQSVASWAISD
eukprot:m.65858 g.65858  ORF g.65858 m.65858 type:complete len:172 (-) comp11763_c0_seq4:759-1274(-)